MTELRFSIFVALLTVIAPLATTAEARTTANPADLSSAYELDASYFDDADELKPVGQLDGVGDPARLPPGRRAFCGRNGFDIAQNLLSFWGNDKIAFNNPPGSLNSGLCWWHTRFQRSAAYLANYFPGRPKPSHAEGVKLIDRLISMDSVVEIPGYATLQDFTLDYQLELTTKLDRWAWRNYLDGTWLERVPDAGSLEPAEMRSRIEALYVRMLAKPQLLVLRIHKEGDGPGYSHALLLLSIEPIRGGGEPGNLLSQLNPTGYRLKFIDSNASREVLVADYHFGEHNLTYCLYGMCSSVVPYTAFDDELALLERAIRNYCKP